MGMNWGNKTSFPFGQKGKKKRQNPETPITRDIRKLLKILHIPHEKHWAGPMSAKGIPDLIGTIPGETWTTNKATGEKVVHPPGRAFWCEVKIPGGRKKPEQIVFIETMKQAGAISFFAESPDDVLWELSEAGYGPAVDIMKQFPNKRRPGSEPPAENKPDPEKPA